MPAASRSTAGSTLPVLLAGQGSRARISASTLSSSAPRTMSVSVHERYATPTSTPSGRTSLRRLCANASTPDLLVQYADISGVGVSAASEAICRK
jgi:hypothetical protein